MKLQSINPATEEVIGEAPIFDREQVNEVVEKARAAFADWKNTPYFKRAELVKEFSKKVKQNKETLAHLITMEMGKPLTDSNAELAEVPNVVDWFVENTEKYIKDKQINLGLPAIEGAIFYEPVGVVGCIFPWNFPIVVPLYSILPALLTGNAVIYKPSELAPLCGQELGRMFSEAGFPEGVFNVITGDDKTGEALVKSDINIISLTGSTETGKKVASAAAPGLKRLIFELGGSDPFIVCADADLDLAVSGAAFGRFNISGQVCISAKRFFVEEKIFDEFLYKFVEIISRLRVGNGLESGIDIGPLVSKEQLERLEAQFRDAVKKGAKVECGGEKLPGKGYFFKPTVLTNVTMAMKIMTDEVFGPIAPIVKVSNLREAIDLANKTEYGLGASIWTTDFEKGKQAARELEAGMVWINDIGTPYPQLPFGGIKKSGFGREMSEYGILEFVNLKTIVIDSSGEKKEYWY